MKKVLQKATAVFLALVFLCASLSTVAFAAGKTVDYVNGSYTAEKITNPTAGSGEVDGFINGGDRMNSYAWSMGETEDYIFVGGNRNILLASAMYGGELFTSLVPALDVLTLGELPPVDFSDRRARLFMIDKKTNEVKLAYTSERDGNGRPLDTGYRSANAAFTPEGSDSESYFFGSTGAAITRVLRIDKGYDPDKGDTPTEVIRFDGQASIRAMTVHDDTLMFGVAIPGEGPVIYASKNPEGPDSWSKIGGASDFPGFVGTSNLLANGFINDMISFNGSVYVAFSNSQAEQSDSGFLIYKGTYVGKGASGANEEGWKWEAIVADEYGKYDKGMGNMIAVMGTFHKYTVNGKEYIYVGTASDPFTAIFPALAGDFSMIYNVISNPIELYRFDAQDNWELVIGSPETNKYFDKKLGNYYDGFDNDKNKNGSCEQYIWALEEHEGKLYVGTFDASTLLKYITIGVDNEKVNEFFNAPADERKAGVDALITVVNSLLARNGAEGLSSVQTAVVKFALNAAISTLSNIDVQSATDSAQKICATSMKYFDTAIKIIGKLLSVDIAEQLLEDSNFGMLYKYVTLCNIISETERGAGLYVTSDGAEFSPVTRNGFNDEFNWGVRGLVSTEKGLYIGTANPFYGGQVWLLNDASQRAEPLDVWDVLLAAVMQLFELIEFLFS